MAIYIYRSIAYWNETDAAGIVHFSNFFRYCERAEEDFWINNYGGLNEAREKFDVLFPRVRAECKYYFPIYPYDKFRVEIEDIILGNSSITYRHKIFNESRGDRLSAECTITVVCVKKDSMKSVPLPEELRNFLKRHGAKEK